MLMLKTRWGNFFPHNAVRIDVHIENAGEKEIIYKVYLSIDNHKMLLCEFEDEIDAVRFTEIFRHSFEEMLEHLDPSAVYKASADGLCREATNKLLGITDKEV